MSPRTPRGSCAASRRLPTAASCTSPRASTRDARAARTPDSRAWAGARRKEDDPRTEAGSDGTAPANCCRRTCEERTVRVGLLDRHGATYGQTRPRTTRLVRRRTMDRHEHDRGPHGTWCEDRTMDRGHDRGPHDLDFMMLGCGYSTFIFYHTLTTNH